jgi:hypothetical protein
LKSWQRLQKGVFNPVEQERARQLTASIGAEWVPDDEVWLNDESRLVDQADQTHLWCMPEGMTLEIGFPDRDVRTNEERLAALRATDPALVAKGSQRDWRPGIPTGPHA